MDQRDSLASGGGGQGNSNPTRYNLAQFRARAGFDVPKRLGHQRGLQTAVESANRIINGLIADWSLSANCIVR